MHTYHCNPVLGFSEAAWMPEPSLFLPTLLNLCQPCDLHSKSFPTHLWHLCCGIALVLKHGRGGWGGLLVCGEQHAKVPADVATEWGSDGPQVLIR